MKRKRNRDRYKRMKRNLNMKEYLEALKVMHPIKKRKNATQVG